MSLPQGRLLIGWGKGFHKTQYEVDPTQPAFYFSDFFLKKVDPWIQYSNWIEVSEDHFLEYFGFTQPSPCEWSINRFEQFKQFFERLSDSLKNNVLQKAVLYVFASTTHHMSKERLMNSLKNGLIFLKLTKGHLYGYWEEGEGILGVTPEILFYHHQEQPKQVKTMALAGTCHSTQNKEAFLLNEKELHEHRLVVEGICQSLQTVGEIKVGTVQFLQLPKLTHLLTPIEIELKDTFCFHTLVDSLHPTPALGTFPIREGEKWLEDYEKEIPRHFYGAPIGFQYPEVGISHCFVGIRNVQWNSSGMRIGAGCGVVKQSIFQKEWQEIQFKIQAIREQFHL